MESSMPASRGSLLTRRAVATGSLIGVGLIATTVTAPAALATGDEDQPSSVANDGTAESTTVLNTETPTVADGPAVQPFFGTGKQATVTVAPAAGTAPTDLDLSGAELDLVATGTTGPVIASCTTTSSGSCTFYDPSAFPPTIPGLFTGPTPTASNQPVSDGTYDMLEAQAAAGLARVPGVLGTIQLTYFGGYADKTVTAASLFRSTVKATVSTADTPPQTVPNVTYRLSGTPYARRADLPVDASGTFPRDGMSNADGVITYAGWFPPGDYTLSPQGATDDGPTPFGIAAKVATPPEDVLVHVIVGGTAATGTGTPSTDSSAPTTTSAAPTPVAPAPTPAAPTTTQAAPRRSAPAAAAPAAATTTAAPSPSPATLQPGNALPEQDRESADGVQPGALAAAAPALETRSRTFPYTSVLAFGGPFVAAVIAAVVLILRRRRARYEYDA
jgi:cell division septation protein DedD